MGAELTGRRNRLDQWLLAVAGDVEGEGQCRCRRGMEPALKKREEFWREERSNWVA